ncbi:MAG: pilus assembly protein PilM [Patescibacteria group bacterium]
MALFFEDKFSLGLDISDYKLRLVQLNNNNRRVKLVSFSEVDVPHGIITDGIIIDQDKIVGLLKLLKKDVVGAKIQKNKIIVSLPEKQSFMKLEDINTRKKELILDEISKHLPFKFEEIYLDYKILPNYFNNSDALHFSACKKTFINNYLDVLNEAGYEVEVMEVETEAITRCLLPNRHYDDQSVYIIVDIGQARTTVFIVYKNTVTFSISFATVISNHEAYISDLLNAINKVIIFYNNHLFAEARISTIITCGSGAYIKNLSEITQDKFQLNSLPGNPWQNIKNGQLTLMKKMQYPLAYTTAIGLALRRSLNKDYI